MSNAFKAAEYWETCFFLLSGLSSGQSGITSAKDVFREEGFGAVRL